MKIRGRLIIAFLIMTLFPIIITFLSIWFVMNKQTDIMADSYGFNQKSIGAVDIFLNPFSFFYEITVSDYSKFQKITDNTPDMLLQRDILEEENQKLLKKESFLILTKEREYYYIGDKDKLKRISYLPLSEQYSHSSNYMTYVDQYSSCILKGITFLYSDRSVGQLFIVTDYSSLEPRWINSLKEILITFLMSLITTATLLTIWIYESILRPLNILRLATMQIGEGNLDTPIQDTSMDEIGQLCRDFDEMRIRLKKMIEEKIVAEENTREIISSISHDLKTPITAIKGYTEGIIDGVADSPEKQMKYLQTIYAKANDMTYLIDELSIFSKVERNSLVYDFTTINLEHYFTDCIADVSLDLESKGITIGYKNDTAKDTRVVIDAEQLKRVLHNIIGNAVKYMDKANGHISIKITDVPSKPSHPPLYRQINEDGTDLAPQQTPNEYIQVKITDNGPGIDAKDLPHIFERFYRADASRNSSKRGSGIGLSIVKVIITEHGGKIWAESEKGQGSSFYFTLKKETTIENI